MVLERLKELGLELPKVAQPVASYLPARKFENQVFVSGQLPIVDGSLMAIGPLIPGMDIAHASNAIKHCFLNGLAAALAVSGDQTIIGVIKLGAFVSCSNDFTEHHLVANGASEIAREIFGEQGRHARFATGVPSLPLNASVELEMLFALSK